MINPGVISLAKLNETEFINFPYRFEIEDNIGESIHVHFKDIRLDLTVSEFTNLALKMAPVINSIVDIEKFDANDFDPLFLMGNAWLLPSLKKVEVFEENLENLLVDTFDENGEKIFAPVNHSRVFKALCGFPSENDSHTVQENSFSSLAPNRISNSERIICVLNFIKKNGYPYRNNLITVNEKNQIIDGQHRAACLYYLYGDMKIKVRRFIWGKTKESEFKQKSVWSTDEIKFFEEEKRRTLEQEFKHATSRHKVKNLLKKILWASRAQCSHNQINIEKYLNRIEQKIDALGKNFNEI